MLALLDLLDKGRSDEFGPAGDDAQFLGPQVESFHQIVSLACERIFELAVELRGGDQRFELAPPHGSDVQDGNGLDSRAGKPF